MKNPKFRFWNKKLKKLSKSYGLGIIYEHLTEEWGCCFWEDIEIEQFTGLHDSEGKEIYEGDILEGPINQYEFDSGEIFWSFGAFYYDRRDPDPLYSIDLNKYKVIGNIHESVNVRSQGQMSPTKRG